MTLRKKMLLSICMPVLFILMILSGIAYWYSSNLLSKDNTQLMKTTAEKFAFQLERYIGEKKAYVETTVINTDHRLPTRSDFESELMHITQAKKRIFWISM